MNFKHLRIVVLLSILTLVALDAWMSKLRVTSWNHPLRVVVYPINADGRPQTQRFIEQLDAASFEVVESYMRQQARRYDLQHRRPLAISLAPQISTLPPIVSPNAPVWRIMGWSLMLRYWMWRQDSYVGPAPQLRLLAMYYDPQYTAKLSHSFGLEKGRIARANLFASRKMRGSNSVIFLHELLHTLGASDKYLPGTNLPRYPDGYAEPQRLPLYPQRRAEIMGGRIPLSESKAKIPGKLKDTLIGPLTAQEIGWNNKP